VNNIHAEKCPLCYGTGNKNGIENVFDGTVPFCKGCGGRGWVEVNDESSYYVIPSTEEIENSG